MARDNVLIDPRLAQADPPAALESAGTISVTEESMRQVAQVLSGMADMLRATNERMTELERQVRLLTKVTPAQANAIHAAIRERAAALTQSHRLPEGCQSAVANALRRDIRLATGVRSMRELPRCDYDVTMQRVALWDDFKAIRAIRARADGRTGA